AGPRRWQPPRGRDRARRGAAPARRDHRGRPAPRMICRTAPGHAQGVRACERRRCRRCGTALALTWGMKSALFGCTCAFASVALAGLAGACDDDRGRGVATAMAGTQSRPSFRWLPGFLATAISTERSPEAADQLAAWSPEQPCPTWDARAIVADVAPAGGRETVVASVASGVVGLHADQRPLPSAPLGAT